MSYEITFHQLQDVICQQGIATKQQIHPESDFRENLGYKTGDIRELAGLLANEFSIELTLDQIADCTTVDQLLHVLNQLAQAQPLPFYPH